MNNKSLELMIYEKLGVRKFRKLAFLLRDVIVLPFHFLIVKDGGSIKERRESFNSVATNYNIGNNLSYESIKKFKKSLYSNSIVHTIIIMLCLLRLGTISSIVDTVLRMIAIIINIYCIMLQRYNYIRVNNVLKKLEARNKNKNNESKKEIIKEDSLQKKHTYSMEYNNENNFVAINDLINNSSLEQLKEYKDFLKIHKTEFERNNEYLGGTVSKGKKKVLKFEEIDRINQK